MRKLYFTLFFSFYLLFCSAQNLVLNGDFEQYYSCPDYFGQVDTAQDWLNPAISILVGGGGGTPDYLNQCALIPGIGVPSNGFGNQAAHSGTAYMGIELWYGGAPDWREYIETRLSTLLHPKSCYYFEMYISLGDDSKYTSDDIGVYFSNTLISGINYYTPLPFTPQIVNTPGNYPNLNNWILVSGNYVATGFEQYMIIGNFKNDASTNIVLVNSSAYFQAYCYIDDVSLTQCVGSTTDENKNIDFSIYPNPFTDNISIRTNKYENLVITIFDLTGRILFQEPFSNSKTINTTQLAKGIYMYQVRTNNEILKMGKVIKQ